MVNSKVFFSGLKSGRCSSTVEARLLRFWEARNVKRGGELMWADLLFVDVNGTIMQASISANCLPQFQDRLSVGTMFSISGFDVARCAQNYRLAYSSILIRFNETTSFEELSDPVSPLPKEGFRFRNQSELFGLANTNRQLPDVIGETLGVKSTVTDPPEERNRVMVTMKLDRLVARDTGLPSAAPLLRSYAKVEKMTIPEFNNFFLTAYLIYMMQEIDFLCTGRVVRVDAEKGWCYVAWSKCSKKLQRTASAFTCGRCNNSHTVGALRDRVEMAISDDSGEGTFVWFDGVMTKLHSRRASEAVQMLAVEGVNPEDSRIPPFIVEMEGNAYTFQVRVTAYNFTEHHKTFTITRVVEEHGRLPIDDVNGGNDDDKPPRELTTDDLEMKMTLVGHHWMVVWVQSVRRVRRRKWHRQRW
ncbi:hypothetical protein Bca52824_033820 [Brassica carinata]|uniref:Replication factor A C-terminal domain-containing protein n=1 Tax=Brassica carinata TaxID=52824 RepID=A0A8X7SJF4_BRACI|nr:hypothetical protein Bca52824_033820 [Brassica carinata]